MYTINFKYVKRCTYICTENCKYTYVYVRIRADKIKRKIFQNYIECKTPVADGVVSKNICINIYVCVCTYLHTHVLLHTTVVQTLESICPLRFLSLEQGIHLVHFLNVRQIDAGRGTKS